MSMVIVKRTKIRQWVYCLLVRGFALCMQSDVFVEIAGVSEGTETELALQWFVSSVGPATGDITSYLKVTAAWNVFLQKLIVAG
jgi:hypothetical protein